MLIPAALAENCSGSPERTAWLDSLPKLLEDVSRRWHLEVGDPFDGPDVSASWVAPCARAGTPAVLKLPMPHFEGAHELEGLRFWNGEPTVHVLEADDATGAMLLERCAPGTTLRELDENEQDGVIADALHEMWRPPPPDAPFRSLGEMIALWTEETREQEARWPDAGLVRAGLDTWDALVASATERVVLVTDLHAGNVLRSRRRPWLVIDPKPFVGERAYDATQHLVNCGDRMSNEPLATIERVSDLLAVDRDRVRAWMFGRAAAELREGSDVDWLGVARQIEP